MPQGSPTSSLWFATGGQLRSLDLDQLQTRLTRSYDSSFGLLLSRHPESAVARLQHSLSQHRPVLLLDATGLDVAGWTERLFELLQGQTEPGAPRPALVAAAGGWERLADIMEQLMQLKLARTPIQPLVLIWNCNQQLAERLARLRDELWSISEVGLWIVAEPEQRDSYLLPVSDSWCFDGGVWQLQPDLEPDSLSP